MLNYTRTVRPINMEFASTPRENNTEALEKQCKTNINFMYNSLSMNDWTKEESCDFFKVRSTVFSIRMRQS